MPVLVSEKLLTWLSAYPHWEVSLANICVLPKGMEETSRQEDVLGNTLAGCRYYVTLFWELPTTGDEAQDAERLLKFIQWVQHQSASGQAPRFGDMPTRERIRVEKGGLTAGAQFVTYTVTLIADFMKVYEVN